MAHGTLHAYTAELLADAEDTLERQQERYSWGSVRHVLRWYYRMRIALDGQAQSLPDDRYGTSIDTSRSMTNHRDDILSVVVTTTKALEWLRVDDSRGYDLIVRSHAIQEPQSKTAQIYRVDQSTVSRWLSRAESSLIPIFRDCGLLNW